MNDQLPYFDPIILNSFNKEKSVKDGRADSIDRDHLNRAAVAVAYPDQKDDGSSWKCR